MKNVEILNIVKNDKIKHPYRNLKKLEDREKITRRKIKLVDHTKEKRKGKSKNVSLQIP